jgi:hypothetical protein
MEAPDLVEKQSARGLIDIITQFAAKMQVQIFEDVTGLTSIAA